MNLKKRLRHLAEKALVKKDYGKSETLIKACKELDGTFITTTTEAAVGTARKFGISAQHMDKNLEGLLGPFFFDHKVIAKMFQRAADKIESMEENEAHYQMLKEENASLKEQLADTANLTDKFSVAVEKKVGINNG